MTATEPASLDALLRTATPVEAEPFDLDEYVILPGTREEIARHVNAERVRTEQARALAVTLEAELTYVYRNLLAQAREWASTDEPNGYGAGVASCGEELHDLIGRLQERAL